VKVLDSFEKPKGKFPDTYGNLVILDSRYIVDLLIEMIQDTVLRSTSLFLPVGLPKVAETALSISASETILADFANITINEFAFLANGVLKN